MVYKPFIVHPEVALVPALAACVAHRQGKFSQMEKLIWAKGFAERDLGEDKMTALATEAGLDMQRFAADMESDSCLSWIQSSQDLLARLGVDGTPAFFINGCYLSGARDIGVFKKLIDEEMAKADAAIAEGTPLERYYAEAVVEAGLTEVAE